MAGEESRITVMFAIAANVCIAVMKFVVAALTGSSAMLSEGIHSLVDTGDGVLLYIGLRRARMPADDQHPFGHGKEIYFWTLVVAILVFAVGGGMSIYEGIVHLIHPHPMTSAAWAYAVLGGSVVFEGTSWTVAWRQFKRERGGRGVWLAGLLTALAGVILGQVFASPIPDAVASLVIGLLLMTTATVLARTTLRLLVGQSADDETIQGIRGLARADAAVRRVGRVLAVHFGPHDIVAQVELFFDPQLHADGVAKAIDRLQRALRDRYPDLKSISVEAELLGVTARDG
jgi:cation diffusion facilitator family transporter